MTIKIGTININFIPLIIALCIILAIAIINFFFLRKQWSDILRVCQQGEYDKVIEKAKKMLKIYKMNAKIYDGQNIKVLIENLNLFLAISYLAQSNNEQFIKCINEISDTRNEKQFWLTLYYLLNDNLKDAEKQYQLINACQETQDLLSFLDGIFLYKKGSIDIAKEKLENVYSKLNYPILREIAHTIKLENTHQQTQKELSPVLTKKSKF